MPPSVAVASVIDTTGNAMVSSLSMIVPVATAWLMAALLALLRVTVKVSVSSGIRSSVTSRVMVLLVSLAAKVSVPVRASMLAL